MVDCDDLRQQRAEVYNVRQGFKGRFSREGEDLESSVPIALQHDVVKVLQLPAQIARSTEDFMIRADCCDESTSWDGLASKLPFSRKI